MYMRWHNTKKLTEKNIAAVEFSQHIIGELDKVFNQNVGLVFKDIKSCKGGITYGQEIIILSPENVQNCFERGFTEYYDNCWWDGAQNPLGFRAIMLLTIHEYAHTLFFKWGYHKKGIKAHSRQFMDICRHIFRIVDFEKLHESWQESKVCWLPE